MGSNCLEIQRIHRKKTFKEKVTGIYLLDTPPRFKYPSDPKSLEDASDRILQAVLNSDKKVILKNNVRFTITKVGDKDSHVGFGSHGGGYYSPEQTIYANIVEKIMVADKQIENAPLKSKKGIVLLVNKYRQADFMGHIFGGLSLGIDRLIQIKNIDEIWIEQGGETKTYELVYDRLFFENLLNGNLIEEKKHLLLFEKWIFHFSDKKWRYHSELFRCLKAVLKNKRPDELFGDRFARQQMVRLGIPLGEAGDHEGVVWLIDKFFDDKNPSIVPIDGEKDYEKELLAGGSGDAITSVVGDVVWRAKELSWKQELIGKALDYIERLAHHPSGYVKTHCTYALMDISNNRGWLKGFGVYPRVDEYKKFHDIVFYLLDFLRKHPSCAALSRTLSSIFKNYTDLTVDEGNEVLEVLKISNEFAELSIYYAFFRGDHYKDLNFAFEPVDFVNRIKSLIANNDPRSRAARPALAWCFWKRIKDNPSEFSLFRQYIVLLFECDYETELFSRLRYLLDEVYKLDVLLGSTLFKKTLENLCRHFENVNSSNQIWFRLNPKVLKDIARTNPDEYQNVLNKIIGLWKKGGNFGSLVDVFETYIEIQNPEKRECARVELLKGYLSMLVLGPAINSKAMNDLLLIGKAENEFLKTDVDEIQGALKSILVPAVVDEVKMPEKRPNLLEDEDVEVVGEKEDRFEFIYYELLGKTTRRVNQALGRYLSPAEIDFISAKLKSFLKDQGF